jgi:hypothetical protein
VSEQTPTPESAANPRASLYRKIHAVMSSIDGVEKRGKNQFHNYKYVTERDIVAAIRESLIEQGLILAPKVVGIDFHPEFEGGPVTELVIDFTLIDIDTGESLTVTTVGQGQDKGDKGPYKAMTGGLKYALLKTFLIPTDDDPENDAGARGSISAPRTNNSTAPRSNTTETRQNGVVICQGEGCGKEIRGTSRYSVDDLVSMSKRAHGGLVYCKSCSDAARRA